MNPVLAHDFGGELAYLAAYTYYFPVKIEFVGIDFGDSVAAFHFINFFNRMGHLFLFDLSMWLGNSSGFVCWSFFIGNKSADKIEDGEVTLLLNI